MASNKWIFVIVAHSDDQILGPGGTIAKYSAEGKNVFTIILSYGVLSNPHIKKEIVKEMRINEANEADRIVGGKGVQFFDLKEGKFNKEFYEKNINNILSNLILKYKPEKIITHASDDSHSDHKAVNKLILEIYDNLNKTKKFKTEIYTFGIWRFFKSKNRLTPRLVVDINDTFDTKISALKVFKSQLNSMILLSWSVYFKAFWSGFKHNIGLAEEFNKIR